MNYNLILKISVALSLVTFPAFAQNRSSSLDSLFNKLNKESNFNGNILLAEKGKVMYQKSFGYANVPRATLNHQASTFQTASVSKIFTATAILQLRDTGKLQLKDSFARYFPDFPFPNITLKHLLTHTSGLPNHELLIPIVFTYPDTVLTNEHIIKALKNWEKPLYFEPGEQWQYSNINYNLLALLVEKVSKIPFAAYLKKNIFIPAQMIQSYVKTEVTAKADKNLVREHFWPAMYATQVEIRDSIKLKDDFQMKMLRFFNYNINQLVGDGNVISTTADLLKFDQALYTGKILRSETLAEAFTPVKLNNGETYYGKEEVDYGGVTSYGLGWVIRDDPAMGKIVGHDGFSGGIATMFYRNITKKQTVIAFDNTVGYDFREKVAAAVNILNYKKPTPISTKKPLARFYGQKLLQYGPAAALVYFNERKVDTAHYWWNESELNRLGYDFMHNEYNQEALEVFKLNIILHPASANVYDSYGEVLSKTGKKEEAILMYKKSIALNPENEGGKEALEKLLVNK